MILTTLVLVVHQRGIGVFHWSDQTVSAFFMGLLVICLMATTPLAGRLSDREGLRSLLVLAGLAVMAPGMLLTGWAMTPVAFGVGVSLVGLGMGVLTTPLLALLGDIVPPEIRGSAVGALQLFGDLGGTAGPILGTALLKHSQVAAFGWSAALLALMLPVALWLWRVERGGREPPDPIAQRALPIDQPAQ